MEEYFFKYLKIAEWQTFEVKFGFKLALNVTRVYE
jgi:hypothetical protein